MAVDPTPFGILGRATLKISEEATYRSPSPFTSPRQSLCNRTNIPDFSAGFIHTNPTHTCAPSAQPGVALLACTCVSSSMLLPFGFPMTCHLDTFISEAEFSNREFKCDIKVNCKDGLLKLAFKCGQ